MMLPTHALAGMLLALPVALLAPEHAPAVLAAGLFGGILPDLDLYTGHRKTLHYPVYYSLFAAVAAVAAVLQPTGVTVGAAVLFAAAAIHCLADAFGGGLELRPWEGTSERAVYDHFRGRWIAPRRWVRYDGAPEDFVLTLALAAPLWLTVSSPYRPVIALAVAAAAGYAATRRLLPRVANRLFSTVLPRYVPASLLAVAPDRYLADAK
jgi:hypothetical protein